MTDTDTVWYLPDGTAVTRTELLRTVVTRNEAEDYANGWRRVKVTHGPLEEDNARVLAMLRAAIEFILGHGYSVIGTDDTTTWCLSPELASLASTVADEARELNPGWWLIEAQDDQ